jgi:hypothetical protein
MRSGWRVDGGVRLCLLLILGGGCAIAAWNGGYRFATGVGVWLLMVFLGLTASTPEERDRYIVSRLVVPKYVSDRVMDYLLDKQRMTAIASFILGAVMMRIEPYAFYYAIAAAGVLLILAVVVGCLFPVALLIEWALRKMLAH